MSQKFGSYWKYQQAATRLKQLIGMDQKWSSRLLEGIVDEQSPVVPENPEADSSSGTGKGKLSTKALFAKRR